MKKLSRLFTGLLFLFTSLTYAANQYQIDLLVFRYTNANFAGVNAIQSNENLITLNPQMSESTNQQYIWLPNHKSKLQSRLAKLSHTPNVQIIGLYSWLQPIFVRTIPVHINLTDELGSTLKLSRATFINVELSFNDKERAFTLNRRIKNKELNYFDSPAMGALLLVTPSK